MYTHIIIYIYIVIVYMYIATNVYIYIHNYIHISVYTHTPPRQGFHAGRAPRGEDLHQAGADHRHRRGPPPQEPLPGEPPGQREPPQALQVEAPHLPGQVRQEGREEGRHPEVGAPERCPEHSEGDHPGRKADPPRQVSRHHQRREGREVLRLQDAEEGPLEQALPRRQDEEGEGGLSRPSLPGL